MCANVCANIDGTATVRILDWSASHPSQILHCDFLPAAAAAGCADCAEGGKRAAIFRRFAAVLPMLRISLAPTRPTKQIETGPRESHMECETRLYPEIVCPPCLFPAAAARLAPRAGQVAGPVSSSKRKRRRVGGRPRRERACFPAPRDRCCVRRLAPGSARCLTRRRQEHRRLQVYYIL